MNSLVANIRKTKSKGLCVLFINSGFNLRPTDIAAAIGLNQFKRLNHLITDPRQQEYFKSKYFTFEGKTENIPQDLIDKIK